MNIITTDAAAPISRDSLPAIGAAFLDGEFAGISLENDRLVALILLPGEHRAAWQDAVAWAEQQGGVLPSRIDQIVLFKAVRDKFEYAFYWSAEQRAEGSDYAWGAYFYDGYQDYLYEGTKYRARAVRRVPIP